MTFVPFANGLNDDNLDDAAAIIAGGSSDKLAVTEEIRDAAGSLKLAIGKASLTGTTVETALATISIPASSMGSAGMIRVTMLWGYPNSANNKVMRMRFGGTSGTQYFANTQTTSVALNAIWSVWNNNSTSSQVGWGAGGTTPYGSTSSALVISAVDTTNAVDLVLSGQLANSGETLTLNYLVELIPS